MIDKFYRKFELYRNNCVDYCGDGYTIETSSTTGASNMKTFSTYESIPASAISGLAFFVDQFNDRVHIVDLKRYFSRPKTSRHKYLR